MLEKLRRLPSPALVISAIALILAIGGSAAALAPSDSSKDKKIAKRVANKLITKRARGLSVSHASTADSATHATTADTATSADSATNADSATHATTADTATSADSATNANLVDGHDASCPANTFLSRGLCFESTTRAAASWTTASDDCASAGGMLPSVDQLRPTRLLPGVDLGASDAEANWTSNINQKDTAAGDSTGVTALAVRESGAIVVNLSPTGTIQPYRCVFPLVR